MEILHVTAYNCLTTYIHDTVCTKTTSAELSNLCFHLYSLSKKFFKHFPQCWIADIHFQSCPADSRSWILQDLLQNSTNKVLFVHTVVENQLHWVKTLPALQTSQQLVSLLGLVKFGLNNPQYFLPSLDHLKEWANTTHCSGWVE